MKRRRASDALQPGGWVRVYFVAAGDGLAIVEPFIEPDDDFIEDEVDFEDDLRQ